MHLVWEVNHNTSGRVAVWQPPFGVAAISGHKEYNNAAGAASVGLYLIIILHNIHICRHLVVLPCTLMQRKPASHDVRRSFGVSAVWVSGSCNSIASCGLWG